MSCPGYCYFRPTLLQKLPPLTLCFYSCSLTIFFPKSSLLKTKPFHALLEISQNQIQISYKGLQSLMWWVAWLPLHLHLPLFLPALHIAPITLTFSATDKGICYLRTFAFPFLFVQIPFPLRRLTRWKNRMLNCMWIWDKKLHFSINVS